MTRLFSVLGIGALVTLGGCASIVSDSSYPVAIKSTPDGAAFQIAKVDGNVVHSGTTPQTVTLKSGDGYFGSAKYLITFKKEGFEDQTITLDTSFDGWYLGNILLGGLIGMLIVDPITGAMWKLPEGSEVSLTQVAPPSEPVAEDAAEGTESLDGETTEAAPAAAPQDTLSVITIDQIPASLRPHLIRVN